MMGVVVLVTMMRSLLPLVFFGRSSCWLRSSGVEPPPATPLPSSGLFSTLELSPRHNGRLWAIVHRLPGIPMGPFPAQSGAGWGASRQTFEFIQQIILATVVLDITIRANQIWRNSQQQ